MNMSMLAISSRQYLDNLFLLCESVKEVEQLEDELINVVEFAAEERIAELEEEE